MNKSPLIYFTLLLFILMIIGCEGGEIYLVKPPQERGTAGEMSPPDMPAGESPAGMPIAGEEPAGMPIAGEEPAGMPIAGEEPAGMPIAGEELAGTPEIDCGLYSPTSRSTFSEVPLTLFTTSCASGGCHLNNRIFSLSFDGPEGPSFSPAQIDEGLAAVEPFITLGESAMSQIVGRVIDDHARALGYNNQSPEYQGLTAWIDSLTPCD